MLYLAILACVKRLRRQNRTYTIWKQHFEEESAGRDRHQTAAKAVPTTQMSTWQMQRPPACSGSSPSPFGCLPVANPSCCFIRRKQKCKIVSCETMKGAEIFWRGFRRGASHRLAQDSSFRIPSSRKVRHCDDSLLTHAEKQPSVNGYRIKMSMAQLSP